MPLLGSAIAVGKETTAYARSARASGLSMFHADFFRADILLNAITAAGYMTAAFVVAAGGWHSRQLAILCCVFRDCRRCRR